MTIKLKAWLKREKKMYHVRSILFDRGMVALIEDYLKDDMSDLAFPESLDNVKLLQYAGLNDVSGKEFCAGDIVRYFDKTAVYGEVVFGKTPDQQGVGGGHQAFYVKWKYNSSNVFTEFWRNDLYYWCNRVEVVGNIYENPEMSEVEL